MKKKFTLTINLDAEPYSLGEFGPVDFEEVAATLAEISRTVAQDWKYGEAKYMNNVKVWEWHLKI